jgi:hypothetical protein
VQQVEASRPLARRASPVLLVLVALLFLLPFCSVSCGGNDVLTARGTQMVVGGEQTPDLSVFNRIGAAFPGSTSSSGGSRGTGGGVITTSPSGNLNQSAGPFSEGSDPNKAHVDAQPLAIAALVAVLLALVLSLLRVPRPNLLVAGASGAAAVLLIALQAWLGHRFGNDLAAAQRQQSGSGSLGTFTADLTSLVSLTWSVWYYAALLILIAVAVWNGVLAATPIAAAVPQPPQTPSGPAPPPWLPPLPPPPPDSS